MVAPRNYRNTGITVIKLNIHPDTDLILDTARDGGEGGELVGRHFAVHSSQVGQQRGLANRGKAYKTVKLRINFTRTLSALKNVILKIHLILKSIILNHVWVVIIYA